ncbi:unnamed protein product [Camellia sinensis]
MEDMHKPAFEDLSLDSGDADDDISLCNLPIQGYKFEEPSRRSNSSDQDRFEFCGATDSELSRNNSVVFFGNNVYREIEFRKRDLGMKSASFHKPRVGGEDRDGRTVNRNRSISLRFSLLDLSNYSKQGSPVQKVNISAITSMSAQSRRRMFMFGPMKFKPEMDAVEIKKRKGNRPPMKIPPMSEGGEMVSSAGCGGGRGRGKAAGAGAGAGARVMRRPLWSRSHLATALAKSFGCISSSIV